MPFDGTRALEASPAIRRSVRLGSAADLYSTVAYLVPKPEREIIRCAPRGVVAGVAFADRSGFFRRGVLPKQDGLENGLFSVALAEISVPKLTAAGGRIRVAYLGNDAFHAPGRPRWGGLC